MFFLSTTGNLIKKGISVFLPQIYIYITASLKAQKLKFGAGEKKIRKHDWLLYLQNVQKSMETEPYSDSLLPTLCHVKTLSTSKARSLYQKITNGYMCNFN